MHRVARPAFLLTTALTVCASLSLPEVKALDMSGVHPSYRVALGPFVVPPARTAGLLVKARINGGPLLRLLLDSGTQFVVLDRKTAAKSACLGGDDLELVGAGAPAAVVKQVRANTVAIGDLTLRDVPLLIADRKFPDGIQGVLPLSVFAEFLIRLDIPGKNLDLLPYPREDADARGALRALSSNQLLFLRGKVNGAHEGYFLLDTGASYNAISRNMARRLNLSEALAPSVPLHGGIAEMDAPVWCDDIRLRFGTKELARGPVVALDLSTASRYHNIEVSGLIGYPALADSVVVVNYRDGFVQLDSR